MIRVLPGTSSAALGVWAWVVDVSFLRKCLAVSWPLRTYLPPENASKTRRARAASGARCMIALYGPRKRDRCNIRSP